MWNFTGEVMGKIFGIIGLVIGLVLHVIYLDQFNFGLFGAFITGAIFCLIFVLIGVVLENIWGKHLKRNRTATEYSMPYIDEVAPTVEVSIKEARTKHFYYGFGGWLILFAMGLISQFYTHLKSAHDNYLIFKSDEFKLLSDINSEYYNSFWYPSLMFESIVSVLLSIMILLISYFCIKNSRWFKKLSIFFIISSFLFQCIALFLVLNIQNWYQENIFEGQNIYQGVINTFTYLIVWVPYFLRSKRVKNTYIK